MTIKSDFDDALARVTARYSRLEIDEEQPEMYSHALELLVRCEEALRFIPEVVTPGLSWDKCPSCGSHSPEYGPGCFDRFHAYA